ncbi:formyltransferase family protein [Maridesulfovibrio sp.]|uniref:formyltransferase family protein n=1 Tax=Maridesulfovibrio sp. TaxID=2795000 RepID=UPI0029C9BF24|nr:formyltransferase family protein [Maridesulfovibrio sp.]
MKIVFVILETSLYFPEYLREVLEKLDGHEVVGAVLVTGCPPAGDLEKYMLRHFYYLRPAELVKLGLIKAKYILKNYFSRKNSSKSLCTVRSVLKFYGIDYIVEDRSINRQSNIRWLKNLEPDVIMSINPLIFGKEVLAIPKICCLNYHSGLLPSYKGMWAVFQAVRNGEKVTGGSVHIMNEGIDTGAVLAQEKVPITKNDSVFDLNKKCIRTASSLTLQAFDKVDKGDFSFIENGFPPSYYPLPTKEHWKDFRKKGGRII